MRILLLLVALAVVVLIGYTIYKLVESMLGNAKWKYRERTTHAGVQVLLVRRGEKLRIGEVSDADPDFEGTLEELRSAARYRLMTLNSRR